MYSRYKGKEINWFAPDESNPKINDFKEVVSILSSKGITSGKQIVDLGADVVYNIIAMEKGWSKERDDTIVAETRKRLLQKLKNPTMAKDGKTHARSLKQGKRQVEQYSGLSKKQIVSDVLNGDTTKFDELVERSYGDPKLTEFVGEITQAVDAETFKKNKR